MAIDWGKIGANVVNNLVNAGVNIGTTALTTLVAQKLAPKVEEEKKKTEVAAPAPVTAAAVTVQRPMMATGLVNYAPYLIGGGVVLGLAYFVIKRGRRHG